MEISAGLLPGLARAARPALTWLISAILLSAFSLAPFLSDGAAAARLSTPATLGDEVLSLASSGLLDPGSDGSLDASPDLDVLTEGGAGDDGWGLRVPYRTQFDGSTFEWGNCGVAAIAMAMEYYGQPWSTHEVRLAINAMTGNWATQAGVDWRYLKLALERRGFATDGPYTRRGGYWSWTLEELLVETAQGRPALLLVHYRSLPGHEDDEWPGDHYVLFLGLTRDGRVLYHDPGFRGEVGAYRTLDRAAFERAWSRTWIGQNRTAMVVLPPGAR
jgi:hypothetical protein